MDMQLSSLKNEVLLLVEEYYWKYLYLEISGGDVSLSLFKTTGKLKHLQQGKDIYS